jgi:hypothetical protein
VVLPKEVFFFSLFIYHDYTLHAPVWFSTTSFGIMLLDQFQEVLLMEATSSSPEQIEVASPCGVAWSEMEGNDGVRFCSKCQRNVYNLSGLSLSQAEALKLEMQGQPCARLYRRSDGTVLTQDCPIGVKYLKNLIHDTPWAMAAVFTLAILIGAGGSIFKKADMKSFLRRTEPFASIASWFSPTPAAPAAPAPPPPPKIGVYIGPGPPIDFDGPYDPEPPPNLDSVLFLK